MYSLDEARARLAKLAGHKHSQYSLGGFYKIVAKYKPDLLEPVITEGDLQFLTTQMEKPGRPEKVEKFD